jgi:hypothetical protein
VVVVVVVVFDVLRVVFKGFSVAIVRLAVDCVGIQLTIFRVSSTSRLVFRLLVVMFGQ